MSQKPGAEKSERQVPPPRPSEMLGKEEGAKAREAGGRQERNFFYELFRESVRSE